MWKNEPQNALKIHIYGVFTLRVINEISNGHGDSHASENFCLLNIPALLFHTILFEGDEQYRKARNRFDWRDAFCRFLHENWLAFILFVRGDETDG
jgi:hypothetical protein